MTNRGCGSLRQIVLLLDMVIGHNRSTLEYNMRILDDIVPPWI